MLMMMLMLMLLMMLILFNDNRDDNNIETRMTMTLIRMENFNVNQYDRYCKLWFSLVGKGKSEKKKGFNYLYSVSMVIQSKIPKNHFKMQMQVNEKSEK